MKTMLPLIAYLFFTMPMQASTDILASTLSQFDTHKTTFNANVTTLGKIVDSLKAALATSKAQFAQLTADKTTAKSNVKKYTEQIQILQQQLAETQNNLKVATETITSCEGKISNVNATLGSLVAEQSKTMADSSTAISVASSNMLKAASTPAETTEANNAKKLTTKTQADVDALTKELNAARVKYAAASPGLSGAPATGAPTSSATTPSTLVKS